MTIDQAKQNNQPAVHFDARGYSWYADRTGEQELFRQANFVCDLSYLGFLCAAGADSVDFLQGQLTNDLQQLPRDKSQITGYCSPKGRLICIFRIHHDGGDRLLLQAHRETLAMGAERLRRYIMRAKVSLHPQTDLTSFGVVGKECQGALTELFGDLPQQVGDCMRYDEATVIRHPSSSAPRYQVIAGWTVAAALQERLCGLHPKIGSWAWALLDIENGLPTIFPATTERFIPQTLNMDITEGVNFKKGCYPGQEIIARMHYLGRVKTRMAQGSVDTDVSPQPGDKVYGTDSDQSIGVIVDCVPATDGYRLLTTARLEHLERGDLRLISSTGPTIELRELPYSIDV